MCDKKTSSIVHAQQAPVERVAELMTTAENDDGITANDSVPITKQIR